MRLYPKPVLQQSTSLLAGTSLQQIADTDSTPSAEKREMINHHTNLRHEKGKRSCATINTAQDLSSKRQITDCKQENSKRVPSKQNYLQTSVDT